MHRSFKRRKLKEKRKTSLSDGNLLNDPGCSHKSPSPALLKLKAELLQLASNSELYSPKPWSSIPDLPRTSLIPDESVPVGNQGPNKSSEPKGSSVSLSKLSEFISVLSEDSSDEMITNLKGSSPGVSGSAPDIEIIAISDSSSDSEDVIPPTPVKTVTSESILTQPSCSRMEFQCPMCQMEFPSSMKQIDSDAHIAQCLQSSIVDMEW